MKRQILFSALLFSSVAFAQKFESRADFWVKPDKTQMRNKCSTITERFGDYEIALIVGKDNKGAMVTLVERQTAMVMIRKLENGKNAGNLADTVIDMLLPYKNVVKSITSDNGADC